MVWYSESSEFFKDITVRDAVKSLGKVQFVNYDVGVVLKMIGDSMKEVNKGC